MAWMIGCRTAFLLDMESKVPFRVFKFHNQVFGFIKFILTQHNVDILQYYLNIHTYICGPVYYKTVKILPTQRLTLIKQIN